MPDKAADAGPRARRFKAWARATEQRSLTMPAALLETGRANWQAVEGDPAFQTRLAQELCDTRAPELTLAYRNLVWMLPGFRQATRKGRRQLTEQVCVLFVVRNKGSVADKHPQALPEQLLVYADWDGSRKLFAVPTDVQDATAFAGAKAHGAGAGVWIERPPWRMAPGCITCLVQLTDDTGAQTCALSAQHVLTPYADADSLLMDSGLSMLPISGQGDGLASPILATTLPYGGVLRSDALKDRPSFDVQLAQANSAIFDRVALRRFNPKQPWVRNIAELLAMNKANGPNAFLLLTPDNHPQPRGALPMSLSAMPTESTTVSIQYTLSRNDRAVSCAVLHAGLITLKSRGAKTPMGGDSGAPIVMRHEDGSMTLVGMHIAGNDLGSSWAIPAWQIFNLDFWRRYPAGARVTPLDVPLDHP